MNFGIYNGHYIYYKMLNCERILFEVRQYGTNNKKKRSSAVAEKEPIV